MATDSHHLEPAQEVKYPASDGGPLSKVSELRDTLLRVMGLYAEL